MNLKEEQQSIHGRLYNIEKNLQYHFPDLRPFTTDMTSTRSNTHHMKKSTPQSSDSDSAKENSATSTPSSNTNSTQPDAALVTNALLKTLLADKEDSPLPEFDASKLVEPEVVIEKYPKLMTVSKIPTLAVRLSKEAYFGKDIMALCTVRGTGAYHALPKEELSKLKMFLFHQCHPRLIGTHLDFENTWKASIEAIGQACKSLRKPSK